MKNPLGKLKGCFMSWALVTFVLPAIQHGVCVILFHTDSSRGKGGSTLKFFSLLLCVSFQLIKLVFQRHHVHSKIG